MQLPRACSEMSRRWAVSRDGRASLLSAYQAFPRTQPRLFMWTRAHTLPTRFGGGAGAGAGITFLLFFFFFFFSLFLLSESDEDAEPTEGEGRLVAGR